MLEVTVTRAEVDEAGAGKSRSIRRQWEASVQRVFWDGKYFLPSEVLALAAPDFSRSHLAVGQPITIEDEESPEVLPYDGSMEETEFGPIRRLVPHLEVGRRYVVAVTPLGGERRYLLSIGGEATRQVHDGKIVSEVGKTAVPADIDQFSAELFARRGHPQELPPDGVWPPTAPHPTSGGEFCGRPIVIDEKGIGRIDTASPCLEVDPRTGRPFGAPPLPGD